MSSFGEAVTDVKGPVHIFEITLMGNRRGHRKK